MAGKGTILIVDDDVDLVEALRIPLEAEGYAVEAAHNPKEADEALRKGKPDLILLDVMLTSKTDGFHISYKLKKDDLYKNIPILMLTAIESETGMKFSPEKDEDYLPVEDYITKPVEPSELLARIQKLLKPAE